MYSNIIFFYPKLLIFNVTLHHDFFHSLYLRYKQILYPECYTYVLLKTNFLFLYFCVAANYDLFNLSEVHLYLAAVFVKVCISA